MNCRLSMLKSPLTGRRHCNVALAHFVWCAMGCAGALGQVVIDNTPPTSVGGSFVNDVEWKAMLFTSGPSAVRIDSIVLGLNPPSTGTPPGTWNLSVSLFSVASGLPSSPLATMGLNPVAIASVTQTYNFIPVTTWSLAANTPYALVVSSDATGLRWSNRTGSSPTASGGFSYDGFLATTNSGVSWISEGISSANSVRLTVTAVPELEESVVAVGISLLLVAGLRTRTVHA
jgi:hypothetical protein